MVLKRKNSRSLKIPIAPFAWVFTKFVDQLDDVTVYKLMFPVIGPESIPWPAQIWCSRTRCCMRAIMTGSALWVQDKIAMHTGLVEIKTGERAIYSKYANCILANGKRWWGQRHLEVL